MIKSLTIINHLGDGIKLELTKPEESGFIVKSIDGLGPVKANINTSTAGASDGSFYNSARLDSRSIVMSLKFLPIGNENIEDVRLRSYKYFPIKKKIQIIVETDRRVLQTSGYVESNEPNIFSNNEGCSITINCPDPLFYSPALNETTFNGVEPMFEFPFENDSLTESLIEFGIIVNRTEELVYYEGDGEVGMTIEIHAVGDVENITLFNVGTGDNMRLDTSKINVVHGVYPEWIPGQTYNPLDIVIYDDKLYICVNKYSGTDNPAIATGRDSGGFSIVYWIDYATSYPLLTGETSTYSGFTCTYNGKKYVRCDGGTHVGSPNRTDDVWLDLTNLYRKSRYKIIYGDTITINTRKGNKSITLLRDGVYYNILNALDKNSSWLTLTHGDNVFSYEAESGATNLQFKIYNNIVYDGV